MFNIQIEHIIEWICDNGYTSVALQFPEGLKHKALEISDAIRANTSAVTIIIGDPCYGACDIRRDGADALIHFGHSRIPSMDDGGNVLYIEARADVTLQEVEIPKEVPKNIGLLATIQYVHLLPALAEFLKKSGYVPIIGQGDKRITYPGQVLGCNCSSASVDADAFIFLGEGDFHPLAAAFGTKKDVFVLNPFTNEIREIGDIRDRILRKRFAAIQSAKDADTYLIIVSSKTGQRRDAAAKDAVDKISKAGKKAYITVMGDITPERLMYYDADAYVNTACPRIAMDDSAIYRRPMLTPDELDIVLDIKTWDDYQFDQIGPQQ